MLKILGLQVQRDVGDGGFAVEEIAGGKENKPDPEKK